MGKISNIMENGIAGLVGTLEFRQQPSGKTSHQSPVESVATEKKGSFKSFVFSEKQNRRYLLIALAGTIVQFVVFKMLYPFPDFISDSNSYIATNLYHMDVNLWPIGYSKFLLWVHMISHSDTFLVGVQYFLLEISLAYFFYTILYLFRLSKVSTIILYIFLFFNPLFIYLSNCVLSDAIFTALTFTFLAQFLWMLYKPSIIQVLIQGVIIGLAFTIRYTAMYYPLVAIAGFILSRQSVKVKIFGSFLGITLMFPFYQYTQIKTQAATGTAEFSVFGGWQIANNALYMYGHINVDSNSLQPEMRELDRYAKQFFNQFNPNYSELSALPGTYFIKVPYAILKPYMADKYSYYDPPGQFKAWGMVSPIYSKYGKYLIIHNSIPFLKYYILLNIKNYFLPHLEKFKNYNLEIDQVSPNVQDWFDYITPNVSSVSNSFQGKLFYIYPILFLLLNIYFIGYISWLISTKKYLHLPYFVQASLLFVSVFLSLNFFFSVIATPVVLRYQVVPMSVLASFLLILAEIPKKLNRT